jgi:uncharacterized protein YkwD
MSRMARRLIVLGLCLVFILLVSQSLEAQWKSGARAGGISYLYELEREIYRFTNEVRRRHGLLTLTWETSLQNVARDHSADMLDRNYFSHLSPEGRTPRDRVTSGYPFALSMTGENIWSGTGHDAENTSDMALHIVNNWMASAGHRQNLLNPRFTDIGVGVAARGRDVRATQVFVSTRKSR